MIRVQGVQRFSSCRSYCS